MIIKMIDAGMDVARFNCIADLSVSVFFFLNVCNRHILKTMKLLRQHWLRGKRRML